MNATTRRWPRTLNEAFPHGAEYASSIERPAPRLTWRVGVALVLAVALVMLAAVQQHGPDDVQAARDGAAALADAQTAAAADARLERAQAAMDAQRAQGVRP